MEPNEVLNQAVDRKVTPSSATIRWISNTFPFSHRRVPYEKAYVVLFRRVSDCFRYP